MKSRTRQRVVSVASVVALFLLGTNRTHAIINGTLDGNLHPNVGVVIFAVDGAVVLTVLGKPDCAHRLCYGGALRGIHRVTVARLRCGSRSTRTSSRMSILLRYPTSTRQRSFPALCTPIRRSTHTRQTPTTSP